MYAPGGEKLPKGNAERSSQQARVWGTGTECGATHCTQTHEIECAALQLWPVCTVLVAVPGSWLQAHNTPHISPT